MTFEILRDWLELQTAREIRRRGWLAALGLALTPLGTALGGLVIFMLLMFASGGHERSGVLRDADLVTRCFWVTLLILAVMFIFCIVMAVRESHEKQAEKFYHDDPEEPGVLGKYGQRQKMKLQIIFWLVMTGPRLLGWAIYSFREIARLKRRDTHSCAAVLWILLGNLKRVSNEQIQADLDWLDLPGTLAQLSHIPGVVFLNSAPVGLSLTDELRKAMHRQEPLEF